MCEICEACEVRKIEKKRKFMEACVSEVAPVPCDFKVGDAVVVTNLYGIEIPGQRILGFLREIDHEWRPESFILLDWDCYWFPVSAENLKLEGNDSVA